jgi:hypothetical protein
VLDIALAAVQPVLNSFGPSALLTLGLFATAASAATIHVDQSSTAALEDGSPAYPYRTIEAGIANAASGDKVVVAPGTYKESVVMRDGISLLGAGWRTTVIDASLQGGTAVTFDRTKLGPVLSGFTITGGTGDRRSDVGGVPVTIGGGVSILNSSPVVRDNRIVGNVVTDGYCLGAGVYVDAQAGDHPRIEGNFIEHNVALSATLPDEGQGGGIYAAVKNGALTIAGNRIDANAAFRGGGLEVYALSSGSVSIERNTVRDNEAPHGAGLWLTHADGSSAPVLNNLFYGNGSDAPSATGGGVGARAIGAAVLHIVNNTFLANRTPQGAGAALWIDDTAAATSASLVANNVLAFNEALAGGGIDHTAFSGTIRTNDLHGNTGGDLYDAGGSGAVVTDNLFVDPLLEGGQPNAHRLSPASPLIDAGDDAFAPAIDHGSFPRPLDGDDDLAPQSDLGAFEYPAREIVGLSFVGRTAIDWEVRTAPERFNVYRGALATLRATGEYTQDPLTEPAAARICDVLQAELPFEDSATPEAGRSWFYLVTLALAGREGPLGDASDGYPRVNARQCP